jgi:hypothetical protein
VGKSFLTIERRSLNVSRIADDHPLVKNGQIDKGDTLVTIDVPSEISGWWNQTRIYVYACPAGGGGSPSAVSATVVRVSPTIRSIGIAVLFVVIAYTLCALTAKAIDPSNVLNHRWTRYLDPGRNVRREVLEDLGGSETPVSRAAALAAWLIFYQICR